MSDLIPDEEREARAEAARIWQISPGIDPTDKVDAMRSHSAFVRGWLARGRRVSPVTETADYLFENPDPQPVSKEWLAELENAKSGAEVVSPVTREALSIDSVSNLLYAYDHDPNFDVREFHAKLLALLSVSPPAEVEWGPVTEQEAQAQQAAERRWPKPLTHTVGYSAKPSYVLLRDAFVAGAAWERARHSPRAVEAAPSDTDRGAAIDALAHSVCQKGGHIPNRDRSLPGSCDFHRRMAGEYADIVLASRTSQPVQVEVTDELLDSITNHTCVVESDPKYQEVASCQCGWSEDLDNLDPDSDPEANWREHFRTALTAALGGGDHAEN